MTVVILVCVWFIKGLSLIPNFNYAITDAHNVYLRITLVCTNIMKSRHSNSCVKGFCVSLHVMWQSACLEVIIVLSRLLRHGMLDAV